MTTLLAIKQKNKVMLVADGRATIGGDVVTELHTKLFRTEYFTYASTGRIKDGQTINQLFSKIKIFSIEETIEILEGGFTEKDGNYIEGTILVITNDGRLYQIFQDLSYIEFNYNEIAAAGSGADFAQGALELIKFRHGFKPIQLQDLIDSIAVAATYDTYSNTKITSSIYDY